MRPKLATAAMAAACALAIAACGGSSTTTTITTAADSSTTPTTTSSSASTSATSAPSSTATSASTPLCTASRLALSYLGGQGAMGHGELGFALRNTSSSSCHTFGYPGVLFLDKSGKPLPTVSKRTTQDYFGSTPVQALVVAPGETVSFRLGVTHGMTSTAGCTTAYALQVIPPDDTATLRIAIPDGAYECGTATVSPVRPGTSAYQ